MRVPGNIILAIFICHRLLKHFSACYGLFISASTIYQNENRPEHFWCDIKLHAELDTHSKWLKISVNFTCVSMPQCLNTSVQHGKV